MPRIAEWNSRLSELKDAILISSSASDFASESKKSSLLCANYRQLYHELRKVRDYLEGSVIDPHLSLPISLGDLEKIQIGYADLARNVLKDKDRCLRELIRLRVEVKKYAMPKEERSVLLSDLNDVAKELESTTSAWGQCRSGWEMLDLVRVFHNVRDLIEDKDYEELEVDWKSDPNKDIKKRSCKFRSDIKAIAVRIKKIYKVSRLLDRSVCQKENSGESAHESLIRDKYGQAASAIEGLAKNAISILKLIYDTEVREARGIQKERISNIWKQLSTSPVMAGGSFYGFVTVSGLISLSLYALRNGLWTDINSLVTIQTLPVVAFTHGIYTFFLAILLGITAYFFLSVIDVTSVKERYFKLPKKGINAALKPPLRRGSFVRMLHRERPQRVALWVAAILLLIVTPVASSYYSRPEVVELVRADGSRAEYERVYRTSDYEWYRLGEFGAFRLKRDGVVCSNISVSGGDLEICTELADKKISDPNDSVATKVGASESTCDENCALIGSIFFDVGSSEPLSYWVAGINKEVTIPISSSGLQGFYLDLNKTGMLGKGCVVLRSYASKTGHEAHNRDLSRGRLRSVRYIFDGYCLYESSYGSRWSSNNIDKRVENMPHGKEWLDQSYEHKEQAGPRSVLVYVSASDAGIGSGGGGIAVGIY